MYRNLVENPVFKGFSEYIRACFHAMPPDQVIHNTDIMRSFLALEPHKAKRR